MTDLKSMNLQEIEELISSLNCPKFRAKQIFQWINKGVTSFDEMKNVPKDLKEKLSEYCYISVAYIEKKQISRYDGTVKYLFKFNDEQCVESVVMLPPRTHNLYINSSRLQDGL